MAAHLLTFLSEWPQILPGVPVVQSVLLTNGNRYFVILEPRRLHRHLRSIGHGRGRVEIHIIVLSAQISSIHSLCVLINRLGTAAIYIFVQWMWMKYHIRLRQ